jgi:hypothetical protein
MPSESRTSTSAQIEQKNDINPNILQCAYRQIAGELPAHFSPTQQFLGLGEPTLFT